MSNSATGTRLPLIVKITPGSKANFWCDCRCGGYICVGLKHGWDEMGDLRQYQDPTEYLDRFEKLYRETLKLYNKGITTRKARELWTLRKLQAGDTVVAVEGTSQILGVGEVLDEGYQWRAERSSHKHTVKVEWNTEKSGLITPQRAWGFVSLCDVKRSVYDYEIVILKK
ncbi:MAG TPA: hypothetical protein VH186_21980 [Chloroflexia bacterium]|nr:hypothetical protein [Chloroflexia bacterium]